MAKFPDRAVNIQHAADPQPGDYWNECFSPVALVVDAGPFHVAYLDTIENFPDGWTWKTDHVAVKTRDEFKTYLTYTASPHLGTHCDVIPAWKHWREFADAALAARGVGSRAASFADSGERRR